MTKKECPFCGATSRLGVAVDCTEDGGILYAVLCSCGACGPWKLSARTAVKAWNQRP